jgi:hypothetical protein
VLAAWENVDNPATLSLAPSGTSLYGTRYGNVAPRVGVALKLNQKGTAVLRAGWGLYYDLGLGPAASIGAFFPNSATSFNTNVPFPVANPTAYVPAISTNPPYSLVQAVAPDLRLPRSYQWNVALEKSLGDQTVSATYVGQAGRDLLRNEALYRPNPNFGSAFELSLNDARSNYSALQVQYRRPLSKRIQVLASYTFSHSLDNASDDVVTATPKVVLSGLSDYASSGFDVRHSFSAALSFRVPTIGKASWLSAFTRDWSLESVMVARSGFPLNGYIIGYSPGGYGLSRPDHVPGQAYWIDDATAPGGRRLNPKAFAIPSAPRQGTEGRNDISGFALSQVDLSLARQFPIGERVRLQLRGDAFNVINHPNFANPIALVQFGSAYLSSSSMLNNGLGGLNPLFQQGGPRSIQVSGKLTF